MVVLHVLFNYLFVDFLYTLSDFTCIAPELFEAH